MQLQLLEVVHAQIEHLFAVRYPITAEKLKIYIILIAGSHNCDIANSNAQNKI